MADWPVRPLFPPLLFSRNWSRVYSNFIKVGTDVMCLINVVVWGMLPLVTTAVGAESKYRDILYFSIFFRNKLVLCSCDIVNSAEENLCECVQSWEGGTSSWQGAGGGTGMGPKDKSVITRQVHTGVCIVCTVNVIYTVLMVTVSHRTFSSEF